MASSPATLAAPSRHAGLYQRAAAFAALLFVEKFLLNFLVDFDSADAALGFGAFVRVLQKPVFHLLVSFAIALVVFCSVRPRPGLTRLDRELRALPVRVPWLGLHALCVLPLIPLSYSLYGGHGLALPFALVATLWLLCAIGAVLAAAAALAPWWVWRESVQAIGILWLYAGIAAVIGTAAMAQSQALWANTAGITFSLVIWLLRPLVPTLQIDAPQHIMATEQFSVQVSDLCSGLEGLGLMLAFIVAWLVFFRREYRFPRALILIPAGLGLIFALNVLRIATLFLIGQAGYPDVAIYGFHSQAGWIAFNIAACAVAVVSRRSRWLNRSAAAPVPHTTGDNPTAAFLMPFLGILAAGIVAHAASSGFEYWYGLRLLAGAVLIAAYSRALRALDWRCSWRGPAVGVAVFGLWMLAAHFLLPASGMPAALAQLSPSARVSWIAVRAAAAVLTVPVAEELAYRGYLMRRLQSAQFETLSFRQVRALALGVSAAAFGVMHGVMWLPGIIAGVAYGWVVIRTDRLGEAVSAHATTNALLVIMVLCGNDWQYW